LERICKETEAGGTQAAHHTRLSMDGDIAHSLSSAISPKNYNCIMMIDDAHSQVCSAARRGHRDILGATAA